MTHTPKYKYGNMSKMRLMLNMSLYLFVSHYMMVSFRFEYGKAWHAATLKIVIVERDYRSACLFACSLACLLVFCLLGWLLLFVMYQQ